MATIVFTGEVLGEAKVPAAAVVLALVFYIVVSAPRRILDGQRVSQARESVLLAAAATACLNVTRSRARTVIVLRSRDTTIAKGLHEVGRRVLLGEGVGEAVGEAASRLSSYAVNTTFKTIATLSSRSFEAGDEEARGLANSAELSKETKLPIFMTACFFTPIMLLMYAVFTHSYGPANLVELVTFQFVVIDLAFYLTSSERGPG